MSVSSGAPAPCRRLPVIWRDVPSLIHADLAGGQSQLRKIEYVKCEDYAHAYAAPQWQACTFVMVGRLSGLSLPVVGLQQVSDRQAQLS